MAHNLEKLNGFEAPKGPVVVIVMDGIGLAKENAANAVYAASTPTLDKLTANYPMLKLKAHGTAVGLPSDDEDRKSTRLNSSHAT